MENDLNWLHIGSGPWYAEGWMNVDVVSPGPGFRDPDVFASIFDLPFEDGRFDKIYMGHILEHIPLDQIDAALAELKRVAAPGCAVCVVGPCMDLATAQGEPQWLLDAIQAHDDPPGGHAWTATSALTQTALESGGLTVQEVPVSTIKPPTWCNPNWVALWQCAFLGYWA